MKKLFILGMALLAACAANAIPTLTGPTGGFEVPTAGIAENGATVAIDQATNQSDIAWPNTRLEYGILKNLEAGLKYEYAGPSKSKAAVWNFNAKYQCVNTGTIKVAIGAGVGQIETIHPWDVYVAGTAPLCDTRATVNVAYANDLWEGTNTDGFTLGLADEKSLSKDTSLGAELLFGDKTGIFSDVDETTKTHADIYLSHAITDNFKVRVAYAGLFQSTGLYLGGSYNFGK